MRQFVSRHRSLIGLLLMALWFPISGGAESIDPKAKEVIESSSKFLSQQKAYQVETETIAQFSIQGMKQNVNTQSAMIHESPNKMAMHSTSPLFSLDIISDGTQIFMYSPQLKKYTVDPAPPTLQEMNTFIAEKSTPASPLGNSSNAQPLLFNQDPETIWETITQATYLGKEEIAGHSTHHLQLWMEETQMDAWYLSGEEPVLFKIQPDMSSILESMGLPHSESVQLSVQVFYKKWAFNPKLPATVFEFQPPADAQLVETLFPNPED
ncbi:MAG: DUF2092 domain-containing protein [bacterium]|jgi:hypothetical protein|nr:DUF2092 domain-containing protein [bacterium]